jgi:uncharacterized protein YqgV (UPF0045/DUF77 family)
MMVQFSIRPRTESLAVRNPALAAELPVRIGQNEHSEPLSACVEGSWDGVMSVIRGCHQAVVASHPQVITTIVVVEDGRDPAQGMKKRIPREQLPAPSPAEHFTRCIPVHQFP